MPTVLRLVWKEACGRKASLLLSSLVIAVAVALCSMLALTEAASLRETKRVMRDLGFNLRIIPKATKMEQFYLAGFSDQTMPADSLDVLAKVKNMSYNHLVGVLHGKLAIDGGEVLLMGISEEQAPPGRKKPPMVDKLKSGEIHVGSLVAKRFGVKKGDSLELAGRSFTVVRTSPEVGSINDLRIIGSLADVQQVLGLEGQMNEILAIDCLCLTPAENPKEILQAEIEKTLPNTKVVLLSNIAEARARQRQTSAGHGKFTISIALIVAAIWVAALAVANVRRRASEIGILRALGHGSAFIATLVLVRALLIGLIAAVVGVGLGTYVALDYGPQLFQLTARTLKPQPALLGYALLITPAFAALASLIPAALAISQDPAQVLRKQ